MYGTFVRRNGRRVINISTFQFHPIIVSDKRNVPTDIARSIDSNRRDVQIGRTIGCWQIVG